MKVIFLDIDGVLNSDRVARIRKNHGDDSMIFDVEAMISLKRIIENSDAQIVISSTWRAHRDTSAPLWRALLGNLAQFDLQERLYDTTSLESVYDHSVPRWKEILNWLKDHSVESFVIIDDEWSMGMLRDHHVRCSGAVGITERDADEALRILGKM